MCISYRVEISVFPLSAKDIWLIPGKMFLAFPWLYHWVLSHCYTEWWTVCNFWYVNATKLVLDSKIRKLSKCNDFDLSFSKRKHQVIFVLIKSFAAKRHWKTFVCLQIGTLFHPKSGNLPIIERILPIFQHVHFTLFSSTFLTALRYFPIPKLYFTELWTYCVIFWKKTLRSTLIQFDDYSIFRRKHYEKFNIKPTIRIA